MKLVSEMVTDIETLEMENRLMRARMERLEKENQELEEMVLVLSNAVLALTNNPH